MIEFTHVAQLACELRRVVPMGCRVLIAIDGVDGSGKTPLAHDLAELLPATVISVDRFLKRHQGSYLHHLRWKQLRKTIFSHAGIILVEGVCVRAVLSRLRLRGFRHIYVKALSERGDWLHKRECELPEPLDIFLENERETLHTIENWLSSDSTTALTPGGGLTPFREEVIRYHADLSPSLYADFVFMQPAFNNALQRTRFRTRTRRRRCWHVLPSI